MSEARRLTRRARPAARSAIWSTRWRPPRPAPRPWCFATSASITPASRRGSTTSPGRCSPSASGAATGSRCWSPTARNGWSPPSPPPRSAPSSPPSAPSRTPRELAWALEHSGAAALVTLEPFAAGASSTRCATFAPSSTAARPGALRARGCRPCAPSSCWTALHPPASSSLPEFLARGAAVDAAALAAAQQAAVTPDDICYILYTSGSTAAPKGVTLAHGPLHRQRLRHRRAAAPSRRRPAMARRAAVLVVRLGQRDAGDHDPWRLHRAAGELRAGRGAGADRARALQRLLRHGQHGAGPAGASGSPRAPPGRDAHRAHHRPARGHRA